MSSSGDFLLAAGNHGGGAGAGVRRVAEIATGAGILGGIDDRFSDRSQVHYFVITGR